MMKKAALVMGKRWPAKAISYLEPEHQRDSGFMVVLDDVPEPEGLSGNGPEQVVCLACLLDEHPELGRGLDLARKHGGTVWYDDECR